MMATERQHYKKYHNWIKTSLSLLYLKEGISEEVNKHAESLHEEIKQLIKTQCLNATTANCSSCTNKFIKKTHIKSQAGTYWHVNCRSNICNNWLDALLQYHERLPRPNVEWANCNPTLWPTQPWEVAKAFQPYGCEYHRNAEESDVAALLTFMLDCKYFDKVLSNKQILREIKECRNRTMHSASLEIEDANMFKWHNDMIALLEDSKRLGQLPSCKTAADKIRKLRDQPIELSFDDEEENTALSLQISALMVEVSNIKLTSDGLRSNVNDITMKQRGSSEEFDKMRQDVSSTGVNISQLKEEIEMLQTSLCDLDVPQVKDKVSVLQQHLQSLSEQNQEDMRKLGDRICDIEREMGAMKSEISDVKYQLKSHQKNNPSLHTDLSQEKTSDISSMQNHLISMYDKYRQRVPIYPLRPEWRKHVADLFVKPSMTVTNPRGIHFLQMTHGKGSNPHVGKTETKVETIQDIFYSNKAICKDIFVMGESGSGKSTLCEYLVHVWASCHSKQGQKSEEERVMEVFTFLFYISLREANKHSTESCDVEAMVKSQLQLDHVDVSKLMLDHTCLIMLDGLDEFSQRQTSRSTRFSSTSLPEMLHSDKSTVLTTSRPWKIELLARELEGKIDRLISLNGLEEDSELELVKKIVPLLNYEYSRDEKSEHFFTEIEEQKMGQYLKTPVLLTQMLGLWFSGESLGGSQCSIYSKMIEKQLQFTEEVRGLPPEVQTEEVQVMVAYRAPKQHSKTKPTSQENLPACLSDQLYCQGHKSLLLKLSKLAYSRLFGEYRETALVFDHDQMEMCGMSNFEIQKSLHMGLLTQYKLFGEITQRLKSISFIHKSHQEYFAAIYLSQIAKPSDLKRLLQEDFSDLGRIFEIEKVFTFVCGMNPKVARKIAKVIMEKASGDVRVQQYRQSCSYFRAPNEALVKRIQGLILAGIEEGKNNGHKITAMRLQDLWMENGDRDCPPTRISACAHALDLLHVKSIFMHTPVELPRDEIWRLIKAASPYLHKLVLFDCDISVEMIQKAVCRNSGILKALGFHFENVNRLDFSRLGQNDLQNLLSAPESSLGLGGVILTHSQFEFLCRRLSKCSNTYSEVRLGNIECKTHECRAEDCKQRLDLSVSNSIKRLEMRYLPVQEVLFTPENLVDCRIAYLPETVATNMLQCLRNALKLEVFECVGLTDSSVVELGRTLPDLVNLRLIVLQDMNLSGHEQVFLAPNMKELKVIFLYGLTITTEQFQKLLSTISSHRVAVVMGNSSRGPVTITSCKKTNDVIQQVRDSPGIAVQTDEVEYEGDKCVLNRLVIYTNSAPGDLACK